MPEQTNKSEDDREVAVREWEKEANASLVVDDHKKTMSGIAIAAIVVAVLGAVWYMKQGGNEPAKPAGNIDLTIPERKPVPKLKDQEPASVPAVISASAATPASAMQADDPMKAQREQREMQRQEQERRMLEARMKSAIIPPNTNNQMAASAQPAGDSGDQGQANTGVLGGGSSDRGAQDPNSRFARAVSGNGGGGKQGKSNR